MAQIDEERRAFADDFAAFTEWQATRRWADDLSATDADWPHQESGWTYQPVGVIVAAAGGAQPDAFGVTIHNTEETFGTLEDAERHLWDNFARDEIYA